MSRLGKNDVVSLTCDDVTSMTFDCCDAVEKKLLLEEVTFRLRTFDAVKC